MATFEIKETRKDSIYVVATLNNGETFGKSINSDELEDGTVEELLAQIKAIMRAERKRQRNRPNLRKLDASIGAPIDDAEPLPPDPPPT